MASKKPTKSSHGTCNASDPLLKDSHGAAECHQHAHSSGCESRSHAPGMCHGFETVKQGKWQVVHDPADLMMGISAEERQSKAMTLLGLSSLVSLAVTVAELTLGFLVDSLALYSDGAHQLSDVFFYSGLLVAAKLSQSKGNSASFSFGYHRAQVLGSLMALLLQYMITALVVAEALSRLTRRQHHVNGMVVCLTALVTVATNVVLLQLNPSHGHGHSHGGSDNSAEGVARMHMVADLLQGSVCAAVGAVVWARPECSWLDSMSALFYACAVVISTYRIFSELVRVLMECAPPELEGNQMFNDLARIKGVIDVHCCHVWALGPGKIAMSAHLHIEDDKHEEVLHNAQIIVKHKYGIIHSTLQVSEDEDLA